MRATLVDTNVLLDLVTDQPEWLSWSASALDKAATRGRLFINEVIYAELSVGYLRPEEVDEFLDASGIDMLPTPKPALFLAGKAFQTYRERGGPRTGVLPDFFIGAHASATGLTLLTRDLRRYRTYFPEIDLLTPNA